MKKRNPWFVGIISLITFGFYELYWLIDTRREMNKKGAQIPTVWLILAPLLALLFLVIIQLLVSAGANSGTTGGAATTTANVFSVIIGMVAIIALIPATVYWFYRYAKGVAHVTKNMTSFNFTFWLGILLRAISLDFVWAGVLQSRYNSQVK